MIRWRSAAALVAVIAAIGVAAPASADGSATSPLAPDTTFWSAPPNPGAVRQIRSLKRNGKVAAAGRLQAMIDVPQAVWFTEGTPSEVQSYVSDTVAAAQADDAVPVLVAYDIPGRDCSSYSAGGAATGEAYRNWIDGMVAGLGQARAVVIIEPDGLSLLPTDCGQPDTYGRLSLISYAAHAFLSGANAQIYIDAGNSDWNSPSTTAARLVAAGVADIDGFALNVSNFQFTMNSSFYGTWVSECIAYGTLVDPGNYDACPDQWGSWDGVPLSSYGVWSNGATNARLNVKDENDRYASLLGATQPSAHFIVDTSRNGAGPWRGTKTHPARRSNTEAWCNPVDRGTGALPTANTGVPLADAYVWVKIPGESDGECYRWTSGPNDPYRGIRDPVAGVWFPAMARELADNSHP